MLQMNQLRSVPDMARDTCRRVQPGQQVLQDACLLTREGPRSVGQPKEVHNLP